MLTKWHRAYIQNAYRELEQGTTHGQLQTLGIDARNKKVLDVGCGPGNLLLALATHAPEQLIGIDIDVDFLTAGQPLLKARREPHRPMPMLLNAALPALPFRDRAFDLVTCLLVIPHVPDDRDALAELTRVLKPGGTLLISGHGLAFPIRYLKRLRLKPLQMYLATLLYGCTGKKWIRNTLQNHTRITDTLNRLGMETEQTHINRRVLGYAATYWIKAIKKESTPKQTQ